MNQEILTQNKDSVGLSKVYYDWFIKKGFEIYTMDKDHKNSYNPLGIYKNDSFVGILLPARINFNRTDNDWIEYE